MTYVVSRPDRFRDTPRPEKPFRPETLAELVAAWKKQDVNLYQSAAPPPRLSSDPSRVGKGPSMARYRIYSWHGAQLIEAVEYDAAGDGKAIRIARERGLGDYSEIWEEGRRVRTVAARPRHLDRSLYPLS